ncbi:MAG: hypothetical protein M9892_09105 [Bacteroidetes bacterium]|jgi:hypothetical protein|nr:hypothetical protein [Bacteroidota bacterium]
MSNNYLNIQNDKKAVNPNISIAQFISDLKVVEDIYFNVFDDKDLKKTCTRIRVHYYGDAIKFNSIQAPFIGDVFNNTIPLASYYDSVNNERRLYWEHFFLMNKSIVYERLTSQASENGIGDNPSPYLVHNGNKIDLGQVLYGFESLVYQKDVGDYKEYDTYQEPNPNRSPKTYSRSYNSIPLRRINDLAGWLANVATPISEVLQHRINGESKYKDDKKIKNPPASETERDRYYEISAPDADLFGNVDAIGIYYAYKKLESYYLNNNSEKPRLSDVFELYYTGKSRLKFNHLAAFIPGEPQPMSHTADKRWLIFSIHFGFAKYIGMNKFQWIPESEAWHIFLTETTKESNHINHKSLNERLTLFAEFWATILPFYGKDAFWMWGKKKSEGLRVADIGVTMAANLDPFAIPFLGYKIFKFDSSNDMLNATDLTNIENNKKYFFETKFLPWLKAKILTDITDITLTND